MLNRVGSLSWTYRLVQTRCACTSKIEYIFWITKKKFSIFLAINKFKVGDKVILNKDEAFVKSEFANIKVISEKPTGLQSSTPINFIWKDSMKSMLGKTYKVLPKTIGKKDPDIVALPSPDGSLNMTFRQITSFMPVYMK